MEYAKKYERSIWGLAVTLIRGLSDESPANALERVRDCLFWYASGRRDELISNPSVTFEEFDKVLEVDLDEILQKAREEAARARKAEAERELEYCHNDAQILAEAANNFKACRGGFTHALDTDDIYIDTDSIKYTEHPEPPKED